MMHSSAPPSSDASHRLAPATGPDARPLRIVYVWDADYPWDVRVEKICRSLTDAGHEVHILARNRAWKPVQERLAEGTVRRMPPWRWLGRSADALLGFPAFFSPRWLYHLYRTVRRVRANLIIVRDMPLCATAIWVGSWTGTPVVLDMAENYPAMMRKNFEAKRHRAIDYLVRNPAAVAAVERYCLPRLRHTLVVVEESGDRVRGLGVPQQRVSIVSNTPPAERARHPVSRQRSRTDERLHLVYIGLLEVPRGLTELIDAVAILREQGPRAKAIVIGKGRDADLFTARAAQLGLGHDDIEFLGYVPSHADAMQIVADSDIGVLPHRASEAWNTTIPNKIFDYMAVGLPIISSDAAPFARITSETGAGEVFRSRDAGDLAAAVRRLASPERRAACGAAGRQAVLTRYHWEWDAATLLEVVQRVARHDRTTHLTHR